MIRVLKSKIKNQKFVYKNQKSKSQNHHLRDQYSKAMINLNKASILCLLLCILLTSNTPILPQGIHSITVGQFQINSSNRSQQVMAYYDINEDEYCDVISIVTTYSAEDKSLKSRFLVLYLWDQRKQYFVKQAQMNLSFLNVVSVICTQFYNRNLPQTDIVLTYHYTSNQQDLQIHGKKYAIQFIKVVCIQKNNQCSFASSFNSIQQVRLFDPVLPSFIVLQGKMSLIFRKNNQAFVLNFDKSQQGDFLPQVYSLLKSGKYLNVQKTNTQISSTLAYEISYFGDYNGDGVADLIVSEKIPQGDVSYNKIHFFKYDKSMQKFTPDACFNLKGIQQTQQTRLQFYTLQDINFDGRIDLILLFKSGLIQIHYNKIPSSRSKLITPNGHATFPFDFYQTDQNYVSKIQRIRLPSGFMPISTASIVLGDFNNDGYEEMIIDIQYQTPTGQLDSFDNPTTKMYQKSILLINEACISASDCADSTFNPRFLNNLNMFNIRKFTTLNTLPSSYKSNESFKLSFIDLYKDGRLDLLSHKLSPAPAFYLPLEHQGVKQRQIQIYYNNGHYDAFFMKIRVMRGSNYNNVHENLVVAGGNINCFVTGLSGQLLPKVGNQFSQMGRMLQLPYVFFGLGRTNNYVNDLTVTIPYVSDQLLYQFVWTPIIPNSQIVTLANPEGKWQLTTFIQPTKRMGTVSLLVILSLIILGVVIFRLAAQQKSQDKQNLESFYSILR